MAGTAYFDLNSKEISIDEVPYIYVADAQVYPDSQKVELDESGKMNPLENAVIEANIETKYHKMYEAEVQINSAIDYTGSGKYDYIPVDGKDQFIQMEAISVGADTTTMSVGKIPEEQAFFLTDLIYFKGTTSLRADEKYMTFNGEVKIKSDNPFFRDSWFKFENQVVNPDSVFIPIDEKSVGNLVVGLFFKSQYRVFESYFLQPLQDKKDKPIMIAEGGLSVDREVLEFLIGPESRLKGGGRKGPVVRYNDQTNTIISQGMFNWPSYERESIKKGTMDIKVAGSWKDDKENKVQTTDLMMGINFSCIPKEGWAKLNDLVQTMAITNEPVDFTNSHLLESVAEFLDEGKEGEKETAKFIKSVETALVPTDIKLAKSLPYNLLFSDMKMEYNLEYHSLYFKGDLGLIGINGESVNKQISSRVEYSFGRSTPAKPQLGFSDTLSIYLEINDLNWVYFRFFDNTVETWSSNLDGYNQVLVDYLAKKKPKDDEFRFILVSDDEQARFNSRFTNRYIWKD